MIDIVANLGPIDGSHILVISDTVTTDEMEELVRHLAASAAAAGKTGPAAEHVPVIVALAPGGTLQDLGPDDLAQLGWYRDQPGVHRFTDAELRARDERIIRAARDWFAAWSTNGDDPVDPEAADAIIAAAEAQ